MLPALGEDFAPYVPEFEDETEKRKRRHGAASVEGLLHLQQLAMRKMRSLILKLSPKKRVIFMRGTLQKYIRHTSLF